jgi:hypothetical protein
MVIGGWEHPMAFDGFVESGSSFAAIGKALDDRWFPVIHIAENVLEEQEGIRWDDQNGDGRNRCYRLSRN